MKEKHRLLNGEIRTLKKKNEFIYEVELWLLNDAVNRNNWKYINLEAHKMVFLGTPILCAYVNNGKTIGDGHNMDKVKDSKTGDIVPSFTSATSERIVGALSEHEEDVRIENVDGLSWVVCKGYLWKFYARELVNKIERYAESGMSMSISIETRISKFHMEGSVEVEEEYTILGTTILGDGVAPAVEDARILNLNEIASEFEDLKIRAASYISGNEEELCDSEENKECEDECKEECDNGCEGECNESDDGLIDQSDEVPEETENKPQNINTIKGVKSLMNLYGKSQLAELAPKFEGYTVLAAGEDENGIHVCLMSADGSTASYTMRSADENITLSNIVRANARADFEFGEECTISVDVFEMTDKFSRSLAEATESIEKLNSEISEANKTIEKMVNAENVRRLSASKERATSTLEAFNSNRADKVDEKILEAINADIESGLYTNSVNENGEWNGDVVVEDRVLAECAKAVMAFDKKAVEKNNSQFVWESIKSTNVVDDGSVGALLASFGIDNE